MIHIDLFSGIGGFALATEAVWDNVEHIFCDNDPFCQAVLKKHWSNSKIYGDINELITDTRQQYGEQGTGKEYEQYTSERSSQTEENKRSEYPFILTGGFPCQPFSQAGRRKGTEDDRYLWPEMFSVIRNTSPTWIIAENVSGLLTWNNGMVLEQVCTDLEGEGYEVQPFVIPACATNAPHRRDRVWIIAHAINGEHRGWGEQNKEEEGIQEIDWEKIRTRRIGRANKAWGENWTEVATRLCGMDDGISRRVHRNKRLKALGNSIVPQVAIEIMNCIK